MKLFTAIRQRAHRKAPHPPPAAVPHPSEWQALNAAVRRQEHYNFLHYDGVAQPDPVETTHI